MFVEVGCRIDTDKIIAFFVLSITAFLDSCLRNGIVNCLIILFFAFQPNRFVINCTINNNAGHFSFSLEVVTVICIVSYCEFAFVRYRGGDDGFWFDDFADSASKRLQRGRFHIVILNLRDGENNNSEQQKNHNKNECCDGKTF